MKGIGKGIDNVREKRSGSCRSSSSSSIARRMLCSCGEEVVLLKSNSEKNPGRMFWRCPNWNKQTTCKFFRWADGKMADLQQPINEAWQLYEEEIEELRRKVSKLRMKLAEERWRVKAAVVACIILTLVITLGLAVFIGMNFEGMKKRV